MGESDFEALKYCTKIYTSEEKKGETDKDVTATFEFRENPFFTNSKLQTTISLSNDMPKTSKGTKIEWKEGKCLTVKKISKSQKNKKTGATRKVDKEVKCKSLFGLFADFTDKEDEESINQEEEEQPNIFLLNETVELLNDAVPFSLEYYLGVVENEDEEDEDFEDENDDDEDDEEEDTKKGPKPGKAGGKKKGGAGATGPNKEECQKQ